ncbi:MAG: hypothetical protein OHK0046_11730 [Anaerolineae bacterium]
MAAALPLALMAATLVFGLMLIVYGRTLMPGTVGGDAGELQYAGPLLALVHPTGQPLYVLLGRAWTALIPFGSAAYKMNLLAAVSAALGCGVITWMLARLYDNIVIGAAAGLSLGFGAALWGQAVLADKYGFNVLLAALIIGLALWWEKTHREQHPQADRLLYALSLAFGIGLLHHRSLALFGVGIALMVIWRLRAGLWRSWRRTLLCLLLVMLPPLLVYPTVLPWLRARELSPLLWQPTSASDWVDFLLERHVLSGEALVFDDLGSIGDQLRIYVDTLLHDYTLLVPLAALIGLLVMLRRTPAAGIFLLVSFGLQAFLSANFRGNERQFTYYLPSFVTLLFMAAGGGVAVWRGLRGIMLARGTDAQKRVPTLSSTGNGVGMPVRASMWQVVAALGSIILFALPAWQFAQTYPEARQAAQYGDTLDLWRVTLKSGDMGARLTRGMGHLPQGALVASDWEQVTILWYAQQVEGVRPDLSIVYPIERYAEAGAQPVCLARHLPVDETWHPTNTGALICLNRDPVFDLPEGATPIETALYTESGEPVMALAAASQPETLASPGQHLPLTLIWRALTDIALDYSISLQVLDENWIPVWTRDIQAPVMGMYRTSRWVEDEIVQDYHEISVPPTLPAGRYLWTVVVYRPLSGGTFERLRDTQGNINILGGTFEVR